jgi:hypothetical protein
MPLNLKNYQMSETQWRLQDVCRPVRHSYDSLILLHKDRTGPYQRPQSLIAEENSPPTVTPKAFCDWLVAIAQVL